MTTKQYHYIYKTICLTTGHFYYGVHSTNDINDKYIGSGVKFLNYVRKYGRKNFVREIVQYYPTRDEAFTAEATLLTEAILNDEMCLNLIEGGAGHKHEYDETFKHRISKTRTIRIAQGKIIPTKHSEAHKQKLRTDNPGGRATSKPIYQICKSTGVVIRAWESSRQAGTTLGIKSWRNISKSAHALKQQSVGGFFWRWIDDPEVIDGKLTTIDSLLEHLSLPRNPYGVKGRRWFLQCQSFLLSKSSIIRVIG